MLGRAYTEEDRKLIQQHITDFESRTSLAIEELYCLNGLKSELQANHSEAVYKYVKSGTPLALTRLNFMFPELEGVNELIRQGKDLSQSRPTPTRRNRTRKTRDEIAEKPVEQNQEANIEVIINKSQPIQPAIFERNEKDQLLVLTFLKIAKSQKNDLCLSQLQTQMNLMPTGLLSNTLEDLVQSEYVEKQVIENERYYSITQDGLDFVQLLLTKENGSRSDAPDSNKSLLAYFLPNFSLGRYSMSRPAVLSAEYKAMSQLQSINDKGKEKKEFNDSSSQNITGDPDFILLRLLDETQEKGMDFSEIRKKIPLESSGLVIGVIRNLLRRGLITELCAYYYCINDEGKAYLARHSSEATVSVSDKDSLFGSTSQFCPAFRASTNDRGQTTTDMSRLYPPFTPAALLQTEELEHAPNSCMQFKTRRI